MKAVISRDEFVRNRSPRLGAGGFESRIMPYLPDVIALVLDHYTAAQIREWLTENGVVIGRHAVGRFVRRIQRVLENIDKPPATRAEAILGDAIRKAAAMQGVPTLQASRTQSPAEKPRQTKVRDGGAQIATADETALGAATEWREPQHELLSTPSSAMASPAQAAGPSSAFIGVVKNAGETSKENRGIGEKPVSLADRYSPEKRIPTAADIQAISERIARRKSVKP